MTSRHTGAGFPDPNLSASLARFLAHPADDLSGADADVHRLAVKILHAVVRRLGVAERRDEVEEAVSELWPKVLLGLKRKYDPRRSSPSTFLWRLGCWRALRWFEQRRRRQEVQLSANRAGQLEDRAEAGSVRVDRDDELAAFRRRLEAFADEVRLSEGQRAALSRLLRGEPVERRVRCQVVSALRAWCAAHGSCRNSRFAAS